MIADNRASCVQFTARIREQDVYAAARVTMPATFATAEVALKVDVNIGDPATPAPVEVTYPAYFPDEPLSDRSRLLVQYLLAPPERRER